MDDSLPLPEALLKDEPLVWSVGRGSEVWDLFRAAGAGDIPTMRRLLDHDPPLARATYEYRSALSFAVRENRIDAAALLLERGASPLNSGTRDSLLQIARDRGFAAMERLLEAALGGDFGLGGDRVAQAIRDRAPARIRTLLDSSPELVHARDEHTNQPIHWAVMTRQIDLIDELLDRGADVNSRRLDGARPIQLSNGDYAYRGWRDVPEDVVTTPREVIAHLRKRGAYCDICTAAFLGDVDRVRELVREDPSLANRPSEYVTYYVCSGTPLRNAAAGGHIELVELLLEHGADPNLPEEGIAPRGHALHAAVTIGRADIARLLLEHGAYPNVDIESSADTLHAAVARSDQAMLDLLCSHGAASAVHLLAYYGDIRTAAAMFAANPDLANDAEALENAAGEGQELFVRLMLRYFPDLPRRVAVGVRSQGPQAPARSRELAELLFRHGMDPGLRNWLGITPLHRFAERGDLENAALFVEHGADVNAVDEEYYSTPLGYAAKSGKTAMVEMLLRNGADANLPAEPAWARPLAWARRRGHEDIARLLASLLLLVLTFSTSFAQQTQKPPLHGRHWMAIAGKPLAATAGAMTFQKGGNAVDAAASMLAATATMWDVLSWGGETQALIFNPATGKVVGINALGVAPTGATPEFYRSKGLNYPPEYGPLAATTPGTPGGLLVMLAEYGRLSLADVLAPAIEMANGYPIDAQTANSMERAKSRIKQWKYSREVMLPHLGQTREAPYGGEIFRQGDLAATLTKLVESEEQALREGKGRKEAIMAAYDRFYRGDIAREFVRGVQEEGGLITLDDLAQWRVKIEEPAKTDYKGIEVYKLTHWTQGPVLLQALNILENFDLRSLSYNSAQYIHTLYQAMNLAFADRDFYYGDPVFPPAEPIEGLLSEDYARARAGVMDLQKNDPDAMPGDPYPYQDGTNPFVEYLNEWQSTRAVRSAGGAVVPAPAHDRRDTTSTSGISYEEPFYSGTTSIQTADAEGWVVSITPSGGWIPAVIGGRTGVGLSQRMQSFVLDAAENPYNVLQPGKQPRVTLTPSMALKDGQPFLSFAVQGGDSQDQNLLQFFLNVVEFGMTVQQATEAANFNSFQMRESFDQHASQPGRILLHDATPPWVQDELRRMGYTIVLDDRTSGPINAIFFDREHGTFWGGSSNHGEDYGIGW